MNGSWFWSTTCPGSGKNDTPCIFQGSTDHHSLDICTLSDTASTWETVEVKNIKHVQVVVVLAHAMTGAGVYNYIAQILVNWTWIGNTGFW